MVILRTLRFRNNTNTAIELLGIEIGPMGTEDFSYESDRDLQTDPAIVATIMAGDISVGDDNGFVGGIAALNMILTTSPPSSLTTIGVNINGGVPAPSVMFRHNGNTSVSFKTTDGFTIIPFTSLIRQDATYLYDAPTNGITITDSGWFKITAQLSIQPVANRRQETEMAIFLNGAVQDGSRVWSYHRMTYIGKTTSTISFMVNIVGGDVIDVRARCIRNGDYQKTITNSCNIMIERI